MVRENHPNKCPHICLYLIFKQQTCRSGRSLAGGDTPAEVAHYTYRPYPRKPFFEKVFVGFAGSGIGLFRVPRGGQSLTLGALYPQALQQVFSVPPETPEEQNSENQGVNQRLPSIGARKPEKVQPAQYHRRVD